MAWHQRHLRWHHIGFILLIRLTNVNVLNNFSVAVLGQCIDLCLICTSILRYTILFSFIFIRNWNENTFVCVEMWTHGVTIILFWEILIKYMDRESNSNCIIWLFRYWCQMRQRHTYVLSIAPVLYIDHLFCYIYFLSNKYSSPHLGHIWRNLATDHVRYR